MSSKLYFKEYTIYDIFDRELNVGDYVLYIGDSIHGEFPVYIIREDGLSYCDNSKYGFRANKLVESVCKIDVNLSEIENNDVLLFNQNLSLFNRNLSIGDLVLYHPLNIKKLEYGICLGSHEIFNGRCILHNLL